MPQGIQVFNPDGSLQFDASNRLFRTLAVATTGTTDGSIAIPPDPGAKTVTVVEAGGGIGPVATVSGNTASWSFSDVPAEYRDNSYIIVEAF